MPMLSPYSANQPAYRPGVRANQFLDTQAGPSQMTNRFANKALAFNPEDYLDPDGEGGFSFKGGGYPNPNAATFNKIAAWRNYLNPGLKGEIADNAKRMANAGVAAGRGGYGVAGGTDPYAAGLASTNKTVADRYSGDTSQIMDWLFKSAEGNAGMFGNLLSYYTGLGNTAANMFNTDAGLTKSAWDTGISAGQQDLQSQQLAEQQRQFDVNNANSAPMRDLDLERARYALQRQQFGDRGVDDTAAQERLKQFGLDQYRRTYPNRGIGGQNQAIAQALFDMENYRVGAGLAKPWTRDQRTGAGGTRG